jgi:hypothetical protein
MTTSNCLLVLAVALAAALPLGASGAAGAGASDRPSAIDRPSADEQTGRNEQTGPATEPTGTPITARITDAEKRLFMTDHLAGISDARVLAYRFERRGILEPEARDSATLTLAVANGKRVTTVDYLHEERRIELPAIVDVQGNPILLHFLEREIRELSRLTGGSRNYYRKRIRMALASDPPVTEVAIDQRGRSLRGYRIRIDPYLDDPARSRYEKFATRFYTLVLSPDIPGEVYELRAELLEPARPGTAAAIVQSEVLTFEGER